MPTLVSGKLEPVDEDEEHVGEKESSMAMRRTRNVHRLEEANEGGKEPRTQR